jgi:NAD(P)-dependent dehydrogenase (short-subunit alcohol dehydrogenase family)
MSLDLFDVSKEIVVITGACGLLGSRYCQAFLEREARVVGLDLNPSLISEKLTASFPTTFEFFQSDITDKQNLVDVLGEIHNHYGVPTVLVNNAALDSPPSAPPEENGPFETYPEDSWDKVIDVNLKGTYLCCQVFGSAMASKGKGSIINISSIYGIVSPDQSLYEYRRARGEVFFKPVAYSASKSGVLNLSRYLATYWARNGVRVNSLTISGVFSDQESSFLDAYCARIPIGRMASIDEYNGAVIFLASAASKYMTGANLVVDGGWTAI